VTTGPAEGAAGPPAARRPALRRRLGLLAAALVALFLAAALVDRWSEVRGYRWDPEPALLVAAAVALLAFYAASGAGYVAVVEALAPSRPPRAAMLRVWAVSLLGRYVPGSVLLVLGRLELGRDAGVPRRVSLAATVYEQALGLGVAAVASLLFVLRWGPLGSSWGVAAVAAVPALLVLLHPRVMGPVSARLLRRAGRPPLARLIPARRVLALAAWYAGTATLLGLSVWLTLRGLGADAGSPAFVGGAFLFSFALSMLLVVFPSGLGVREGVFALALAQNVPGGVAVALAAGCRVALTLAELAFVAAVALVAQRR